MNENILPDHLNESQRGFCTDPAKSLRLLAPAGSGKTQSVMWRCQYLARQAAQQNTSCRILVVTFTRVARDELRDRVRTDPEFKPYVPNIEINTLNAWGFRFIKNRMNNPRLLKSAKERRFLVKNDLQPIWSRHPKIKHLLTERRYKFRVTDSLMDKIDLLKGLGFRHDRHLDFGSTAEHLLWLDEAGLGSHVHALFDWLGSLGVIKDQNDFEKSAEQFYFGFFRFWADAVKSLREMEKLSFEDQKYWAHVELERDLENLRFTTGNRLHHIMVDEFQDINVLDLHMLKTMAKINKTELTVVGDDDQAIYEWRGASPDFILEPKAHLDGDYRSHILNVNYRCPQNIVELSQALIQNNHRRVEKNVLAASNQSAQVRLMQNLSISDTITFVKDQVKQLLDDPTIQNIALISRKRSQIIPYQIVFAGDDIPFYAAEDLSVMLSGAFNELKDLLRIKAQSEVPRPFGPDPVEALLQLCDKVKKYPLNQQERRSVLSYVRKERPKDLMAATRVLGTYLGPLKGDNKGARMTAEFQEAIMNFLETRSVADAILSLSEHFAGLQKDYGKSMDDIFYADPPFLYLSAYAEQYGDDLGRFFEDVEKAIDTLVHVPYDDEDEPDESWKRKLHLMTALRAKGKEFDVVFLLDCNEGIWPSKLSKTPEQLESERRVFYVAFTRVKKQMFILVNESLFQESMLPSRYLAEMKLIPYSQELAEYVEQNS